MIYALLSLFSSDLFFYGNLILLAAAVAVIAKRRAVCFAGDFWLLLAFAIIYFVTDLVQNQSVAFTALLCPAAYLLGTNLDRFTSIDRIKKVFICLSLGMAAHGVLNFVYDTVHCGGINYSSMHYDIWSGAVSAVTVQMANFVFILCFSACAVKNIKKYWWAALLLIIGLAQGVLYGSRTYVVFLGISLALGLIVIVFSNGNRYARLKSLLTVLLLSGAVLIVFTIIYKYDLFGIRTFYQSSYLYHRLYSDYAIANNDGLFSTGRWATKLRYISMLPEYPFGGMNIKSLTGWYAHDLWLDTADRVGIIPAVLIFIYTVRMLIRTLRFSMKKEVDAESRSVFINSAILLMLQFFIEPIFSGEPILLYSACIIDGLITMHLCNRNSLSSNI